MKLYKACNFALVIHITYRVPMVNWCTRNNYKNMFKLLAPWWNSTIFKDVLLRSRSRHQSGCVSGLSCQHYQWNSICFAPPLLPFSDINKGGQNLWVGHWRNCGPGNPWRRTDFPCRTLQILKIFACGALWCHNTQMSRSQDLINKGGPKPVEFHWY